MEKIVVIGAGASGLVSAISSKNKNNQVIVLERNSNCGKKILITGNGRCNYWNEDQDLKHYHSNNQDMLEQVINKTNEKKVINFFDKLGITPKIKNGYYYPFSNQAVSIQYALILEAELKGIEIKNEILVEDIFLKDNKFIIKTNNEEIIADKVILALGSKACPKTGSDGIGYKLATKLGHTITNINPALVSLIGKGNYFKKWNGIRTDVNLTLYEDGNKIKEELGEIQLTDYGISGICVFNLSRYVSKSLSQNKKVYITINFLPFLASKDEVISWLNSQNKKAKNRTIGELLEATLNYKLVSVILKQTEINSNKKWNQISKKDQKKLIDFLYSFHFDVLKTNSFDKAQVCSGGVLLSEINLKTMESKNVKNLYIVGELLDVDGECGGYNLGFAWMSGIVAGEHIKGEFND